MHLGRHPWTPIRLLAAVMLSNILTAVCFGLLSVLSWHLPEGQSLSAAWKIVGLVPAILGIVGVIIFTRLLKKTVSSGCWSAESITAAHRLAENSWWTVGLWIYLIITFTVFLFSTHHYIYFPIIMVSSSFTEARIILRAQLRKPGESNSIYPVKPLVSDHWGLPPDRV